VLLLYHAHTEPRRALDLALTSKLLFCGLLKLIITPVRVKQRGIKPFPSAILISKSNNLYRQKQRFNRWQNRDRQSVLDGCNFSYSVIMRVMTFLVGVLKSASSIKMRIAAFPSSRRVFSAGDSKQSSHREDSNSQF
jgi:hypothetical protein